MRNITIFLFIALSPFSALCQLPVKNFHGEGLTEDLVVELRREFGNHKLYPSEFEKQILIALSYYPELRNTPIRFQQKKRHSIMNARATWAGVFMSGHKRHYVITISTGTEPVLMPLLFTNLAFNAQVGVVGHELAHIADFSAMTTLGILKHVVSNISSKYLDRFEYRTDSICIAHGLGYQLLEWSSYVRRTMGREYWGGPDNVHKTTTIERYMNPATITKRINDTPVYRNTGN